MSQVTPTQAEVSALNDEYKTYINKLKVDWLAENRVNSRNVYEVMHPEERRQVDGRIIAQWATYVTPFAETWWKERGYGVIWPEDNSEPMKVFKLEAA